MPGTEVIVRDINGKILKVNGIDLRKPCKTIEDRLAEILIRMLALHLFDEKRIILGFLGEI